MSNTTNTDNAASELGFQPGDIVQEWLWDDDVDGHIRDSIEALTGEDLVDEEYDSAVDGVIVWWRDGDEEDELTGFELGVDEYISKPFSPKILVARVGAILRRSGKAPEEGKLLSIGGIVIDQTAHTVTVDGKQIELSFKEFELLTYFMENEGIALSREKILNHVWNYDYFGDARTIDTHVKKLRAKIGEKGDYIKTIWGMGYKFEAEENGSDK